MKGWIDFPSDVNWIDHGGCWGKKARDGSWYVLEWTDMESAVGPDYPAKWAVQVKRIDLPEVDEKTLASALNYVGSDADCSEVEKVWACSCYGAYAPIEDFSGSKHAVRLRAQARRAAEAYMRDAAWLAERLDRPVNAIGSTARDFQRGDSLAGLRRDPDSTPERRLMTKLGAM